MSTWSGDSKNLEEIEFSRWLFEDRLRQSKNVLPDGLNWLCYFAGSSKSHRENSISFIFLESPHQVDMKNVVKCWKDFLSYFTTLETYRALSQHILLKIVRWNAQLGPKLRPHVGLSNITTENYSSSTLCVRPPFLNHKLPKEIDFGVKQINCCFPLLLIFSKRIVTFCWFLNSMSIYMHE